jgi:hypothetical protein
MNKNYICKNNRTVKGVQVTELGQSDDFLIKSGGGGSYPKVRTMYSTTNRVFVNHRTTTQSVDFKLYPPISCTIHICTVYIG